MNYFLKEGLLTYFLNILIYFIFFILFFLGFLYNIFFTCKIKIILLLFIKMKFDNILLISFYKLFLFISQHFYI